MGNSDKPDLGSTISRAILGHLQRQRALRQMEEAAARERARQDAVIAAPPPVFGSARWATRDDLSRAGHLFDAEHFDNPSSILLGALPAGPDAGAPAEGWIHWNGEGHLLTVAPTRSGKSTTLIVPNLLRYQGSAIVLDPKGELYEATSSWRGRNGRPVYKISPFEQITHGFNPLATIREHEDARVLADLMLPEDPKAQDFFKKDATAYLSALILFVVHQAPPNRRTLAEVRRLTAAPLDDFIGIAKAMQASPIPAVANAANIVVGKSKDRGLPSLRETLNTELSLWDNAGIGRATSSCDVDFGSLKDVPSTVYIQIPFDKMDAFSPFLKVLLVCALEAMIQNRRVPDIPALFVLDEFLRLKTFSRLLDAINTHTSAGIRLWFIIQNLSKLEEYYPTSWRNIFDASVKTFFGVRDNFTAKIISEFLDDRTVAYRSSSLSLSLSSSSSGLDFHTSTSHTANVSSSLNLTKRALLTPGEVVSHLSPAFPDQSRLAITFLDSTPPVLGRLVPYFSGRRCLERHGTLNNDKP